MIRICFMNVLFPDSPVPAVDGRKNTVSWIGVNLFKFVQPNSCFLDVKLDAKFQKFKQEIVNWTG